MDDRDDLADDSIDKLKTDVKRAPADSALASDLDRQVLRRLTQANNLREDFYGLASNLAVITVVISTVLVLAVLCGASIAPSIAIAFISGLSVQVIGILAIVARYLFPSEKGLEQN